MYFHYKQAFFRWGGGGGWGYTDISKRLIPSDTCMGKYFAFRPKHPK